MRPADKHNLGKKTERTNGEMRNASPTPIPTNAETDAEGDTRSKTQMLMRDARCAIRNA